MAEPLQLELHAKVDMRRVDRAANDIQRRFSTLGNDAADDFARQFQTGLRSMDSRSAAAQAARGFSSAGTRAGRDFAGSATSAMRGDFQAAGRDAGRDFQRSFEREARGTRVDIDARSTASSAGGDAGDSFGSGFAGAAGLSRLAGAGGPIAAAIAAGALAGVKVLGPQISAAMSVEASQDMTAARLGLDEKTMAGVAQAASQAFSSNFGESIESNLSTATTAIQSGLVSATDPAGIQRTIEQLTSVSTILGEDMPAVSRAAAQAIRTGIATDATNAFDLLVKGQQQGLNVSGDLLDTVNEYSTQFRKLGLTGPEAFGLLSQAVKGGARDTDVAADALKEFSIRAVDGSKATTDAFTALGLDADDMARRFAAGGRTSADALDVVLDKLRGIADPVEQSRRAVELFGTQAEDLGGALNNFDLSKVVDEFGRVEGASQAAGDKAVSNSLNEWQTAGRNIQSVIAGIRDSLNMDDWFGTIPKAFNQFMADPPKGPTFAPGVPAQVGAGPGAAVAPPASVKPSGPTNPLDVLAGAGRPGDGIGGPTNSIPKDWTANGVNPGVAEINEIAREFGLTMTSGRRNEPGSFHNIGSAGDFSGAPEDMRAFAEFMATNFGSELRELIFEDPRNVSPFTNQVDDGKFVGPGGGSSGFFAGAGDHTDHVHAAVDGPLSSADGPIPVYVMGTEHGAYPSDQTSPTSSSSSSGTSSSLGVPLDAGLGLDNGLAGLADNLVRMAGNAMLIPLMATLGASQPAPVQSYGAAPTMGTAPTFGMSMPSAPTLGGAPTMPGSPIGAPRGTMPPGPFGPPTGPLPGPQQPVGGSGPGGWQPQGGGAGGGPLLQSAIGAGAMAADAFAPGAGMAVQKAGQLGERAIRFGGQLAGIGVSGLMETFGLSSDGPGGDLSKSWIGRLAGGLSQMKPAEQTTAGQTQAPVQPQQHEGSGAPPGPSGPTVHIENFHQDPHRNGQQTAKDLAFQAYSSKGKR